MTDQPFGDVLTADDVREAVASLDTQAAKRQQTQMRYMHPAHRNHVAVVHVYPRLGCVMCRAAWSTPVYP